eukprot:TRINITY_DN1664_c0_g1_i3.p1 TRINITY_DN1664_c0_g1~~TRINITY_DN1664_c0_g1_i3.p1  ORF type:complete len:231 (+),score=56.05 TRINITY_DN1664_c0_g1_i3:71-694(+)
MALSWRGEFVAGASSKFWECKVSGSTLHTVWGKIGGPPAMKDIPCASPASAVSMGKKMLEGKMKKGYEPRGTAKGSGNPTQNALAKATAKVKAVAKAKAVAKVKAKAKAKVAVKKTALKTKSAGPATGGKLANKTVCFTGALQVQRAICQAAAIAAGARVTGSVSKSTDILVVGGGAGGKLFKGNPNMEFWTEDKFKAAVKKFYKLP